MGLIRPGSNPGWKTEGVAISDTESGALFVFALYVNLVVSRLGGCS